MPCIVVASVLTAPKLRPSSLATAPAASRAASKACSSACSWAMPEVRSPITVLVAATHSTHRAVAAMDSLAVRDRPCGNRMGLRVFMNDPSCVTGEREHAQASS